MASLMENYAGSLMATPERLDRFLTAFTSGRLPGAGGVEPGAGSGDARAVRIACLSVALASAGLLLHRITLSAGQIGGSMTSVLFLALGLVVLWAITR
jgi:hypothetical protein